MSRGMVIEYFWVALLMPLMLPSMLPPYPVGEASAIAATSRGSGVALPWTGAPTRANPPLPVAESPEGYLGPHRSRVGSGGLDVARLTLTKQT